MVLALSGRCFNNVTVAQIAQYNKQETMGGEHNLHKIYSSIYKQVTCSVIFNVTYFWTFEPYARIAFSKMFAKHNFCHHGNHFSSFLYDLNWKILFSFYILGCLFVCLFVCLRACCACLFVCLFVCCCYNNNNDSNIILFYNTIVSIFFFEVCGLDSCIHLKWGKLCLILCC